MVNFALQTRKTSQNHDFFIKNQAKSLIFHGFACQNLHSVAEMLTARPRVCREISRDSGKQNLCKA